MNARPFLDTNVVAYALTNDVGKKSIAETLLLLERPLISVQVCNELVNVCVRKLCRLGLRKRNPTFVFEVLGYG